jgi:hypothetical protein
MEREPESGYVRFTPPVENRSDRYFRVWEILDEMNLRRLVAFCYEGNMKLVGLCFPTKQEAMTFRLKL